MRVPFHIVEQRRERLRALIRTDGFLPVGEICRRLQVSEATARRDLAAVAADGAITRTWGGALADYNTGFASLDQRRHRARTAKARIATVALEHCPQTGVIFLDAGTTIQAFARLLMTRRTFSGLVVVTNSLSVATVLGGAPGLELHVLGGLFLHRQAVLLGPGSVAALKAWRFDAAFLGAEGFDTEGITNSHAKLAVFQQEVAERSASVFFCLDKSKLGRRTPNLVLRWSSPVTLITDADPRELAAGGITLPAARRLSAH